MGTVPEIKADGRACLEAKAIDHGPVKAADPGEAEGHKLEGLDPVRVQHHAPHVGLEHRRDPREQQHRGEPLERDGRVGVVDDQVKQPAARGRVEAGDHQRHQRHRERAVEVRPQAGAGRRAKALRVQGPVGHIKPGRSGVTGHEGHDSLERPRCLVSSRTEATSDLEGLRISSP